MNLIDFIIIYLACGAPFGVYYYYQQRESAKLWQNSPFLWLNCLLTTLIWLPFAIKLLHKFITKRLQHSEFAETKPSDSTRKTQLEQFEKEILQFLYDEKIPISPFEFRETLDRFAGLTFSANYEIEENKSIEFELYRVANHQNIKLASILLNRRNRSRLEYHQILARKDFLQMLEKIKSVAKDNTKLAALMLEFAKLINDAEFSAKLRQIFHNSTQIRANLLVTERENVLWKPIEPKPQITNETALNLSAISTTTPMWKKD